MLNSFFQQCQICVDRESSMKKLVTVFMSSALILASTLTSAEKLPGFPRDQFGSIVLKNEQNFSGDTNFELAIGDYKNEPIVNYSSDSIFAQLGKSVGRLDTLTDVQVFPCTAFIVSDKHIMTNYHCSVGLVDNPATGASRIDAMSFLIGYLRTGVEENGRKFTVIPTPVEASERLDYAIHEVIGNPSKEFGILKLSDRMPQQGDPFWIIGHPRGEAQRISREQCRASNPPISNRRLLHTCDTLPGNSGSPVIDATTRTVVALHHAGSSIDDVNFGILMKEILEETRTVVASLETGTANDANVVPTSSCDVLYNAAQSAGQCFAYKAYLKECSNHVLAPIARSYTLEFCSATQPQITTNESVKQGPLETADKKAFKAARTSEDFAKFISDYPESSMLSEAFNQMGIKLDLRGETQLAARAFLNGYMQNTANPIADQLLFNLGGALVKLNQLTSACEVLRRVPIEHPGTQGASDAVDMFGRRCG